MWVHDAAAGRPRSRACNHGALGAWLVAAALLGCSGDGGPEPPATPAAGASEASREDPAPRAGKQASGLAGTSWRLIEIQEMDDSVARPDDPSRYGLGLGADGSAEIRAGCSRGTARWSSAGPAQLRFDAISVSGEGCPTDAVGEQYLAQLEWVRSYVLEGGHLFLATMADGAIIELAPAPPIAGTVLGEELRARHLPWEEGT